MNCARFKRDSAEKCAKSQRQTTKLNSKLLEFRALPRSKHENSASFESANLRKIRGLIVEVTTFSRCHRIKREIGLKTGGVCFLYVTKQTILALRIVTKQRMKIIFHFRPQFSRLPKTRVLVRKATQNWGSSTQNWGSSTQNWGSRFWPNVKRI